MEAAFKDVPADTLAGVRILFIGDAADNPKVQAALEEAYPALQTPDSPTQRVGMILPVDSVIVGPKTVSESQIPAACYLDSQAVS